jgi:hypothetical protein
MKNSILQQIRNEVMDRLEFSGTNNKEGTVYIENRKIVINPSRSR